jgi:uncharacterized protein YndB with AHSA1/START domain
VRRWIVGLAILAAGAAAALVLPPPWDDATRIQSTVEIARDPDLVFDYVTTPANWPKWHPSSLGVTGATDHPLELGEQVTEDFLVAGHRGRAVWTVVEREAPERWVIAGDVNGRKAGAITYTLTPSGAGTRFDREFVYASPSLFFVVLNRVRVRAEVERESAEAVRRLKQILEASAGRAREPWSSGSA